MIRINGIRISLDEDESLLKTKAAKLLRINEKYINKLTIFKKSVDARKKDDIHFSYAVDVELGLDEEQVLSKCKSPKASAVKPYHYELPEDALLCPMIDARRMEVYAAVYDRALKPVRDIAADIVDENSYQEFLDKQPVYFFGDGAAKCKEKIVHPNAHFIDGIRPLASMMFPLAEKAIAEKDFKDVAYFEPFYLKEFVASQPKKLL